MNFVTPYTSNLKLKIRKYFIKQFFNSMGFGVVCQMLNYNY